MSSESARLIEELEYLSGQLNTIREVEDLAEPVSHSIYRKLVTLHRKTLNRFVRVARKMLRD